MEGPPPTGLPGTTGAMENEAADKPFPPVTETGPRLTAEELLKFSGLEFTERLIRWLPGASAEDFPDSSTPIRPGRQRGGRARRLSSLG